MKNIVSLALTLEQQVRCVFRSSTTPSWPGYGSDGTVRSLNVQSIVCKVVSGSNIRHVVNDDTTATRAALNRARMLVALFNLQLNLSTSRQPFCRFKNPKTKHACKISIHSQHLAQLKKMLYVDTACVYPDRLPAFIPPCGDWWAVPYDIVGPLGDPGHMQYCCCFTLIISLIKLLQQWRSY